MEKQIKPKKPFYKKWWFWILAIIVVGAVGSQGAKNSTTKTTSNATVNVGSTVAPTKPETKPAEPVIKVTATELVKAYDENEVKADTMYKDKMLEITGTISSIDVVLGNTVVNIKSDEDKYMFLPVGCTMEDSEKGAVGELKKDQKVTIIGKCTGKALTPALKNCKIVK